MTHDNRLIEYINNNLIIEKTNTLNSAKVRWGFDSTDEYQQIIHRTSYIKDGKITERLYHILKNITSIPKCICGEYLRFMSINQGYSKCCSNSKCKRIVNTWKSSSEKKKQNFINVLDTFIKFIETTNDIEETTNTVEDFIDSRISQTDSGRKHQMISINYYTSHSNILRTILNRTKQQKPIDYKYINKFEDFCFSERMFILKNSLSEIPKCICCNKGNKKFISFVKGYGRACDKLCWFKYNTRCIVEEVANNGYEFIDKDFSVLKNNLFDLKCSRCGVVHSRELTNARWKDIYCPTCDGGEVGVSMEENEVFSFVYKLNKTAIQSKRINVNGELDIYDETKSLAIEYNGVYWHSTGDMDMVHKYKVKHLDKTLWAISNNINLLQIFSNEWKNTTKQKIWKSIIANRYGRNRKIYARKCTIKEVTAEESEIFLNNNHLQGKDRSSIRIGLWYCGELVEIMTFCKSRFNKNYEWELSRLCSVLETTVVGGANRLLTYFKNNYTPVSIITYANLRYSTGEIYKTLGFEKSHTSPPNYFYFKSGDNLYSRNNFQKHLLKDKLEVYDESLTEFENMFRNNYRVIYDCGNLVFVWTK